MRARLRGRRGGTGTTHRQMHAAFESIVPVAIAMALAASFGVYHTVFIRPAARVHIKSPTAYANDGGVVLHRDPAVCLFEDVFTGAPWLWHGCTYIMFCIIDSVSQIVNFFGHCSAGEQPPHPARATQHEPRVDRAPRLPLQTCPRGHGFRIHRKDEHSRLARP